VRRYIEKMSGLSRAQVTRLIALYTASGRVQVTVYRRRRFTQLYTRADIELLAAVDEAHETLSGPATRRILEREHELYNKPEYVRLATISVAHLYNLRHHQRYRERLLNYTKTRPAAVSIGERRKPQPQGQPAFCAWTRCIRAISRMPRAFIISTPSMRSRSGRWPVQRRAFRKPILSRFWRICCVSFRFASWAFTRQRQ